MKLALRVVSKHKGLLPKGGFEVGGGGFCLGFRGKLTNLNSISLSFWQIDNLDSAAWIDMFHSIQKVEGILLIGEGPDLHSQDPHINSSPLIPNHS